jgi:flagellar biosynthesis/type III secretory pathway protein FliH
MRFHRITLWLLVVAVIGCGKESSVSGPDFIQSPDAANLVEDPDQTRGLQFAIKSSSMSSAKKKTVVLLKKAVERTSSESDRALLEKMRQVLENSNIAIPKEGHDHKACLGDSAVLAFVNQLIPNKIFVCKRAAAASENRLTQVLIHEAAHLAGVFDECDATKVEVAVVRSMQKRLSFKNGYMERCGIQ